MDKNAVLGELLYTISRGEKGRIRSSGFWRKQYVNALRESLKIMELLISLLKADRDITVGEMLPFFEYYKKGICHTFPPIVVNLEELLQDTSKIMLIKNDTLDEVDIVIMNFMEKIIIECNLLIKCKGKKYKRKIADLLGAFHNLPIAFFDKTKQTLFNNMMWEISKDEAIEYSLPYIKSMSEAGMSTVGTEEILRYVLSYLETREGTVIWFALNYLIISRENGNEKKSDNICSD